MDSQFNQILQRIQLLKATHQTLQTQTLNLNQNHQKLKSNNKLLASETQVQRKKTHALMLLCSELQKKHDTLYFQTKSFQTNPQTIKQEKEILKQLLIRQGEEIQLYKQLNHFLKQHTLNKSKQQFDSFINKQSQISAKLQSKLYELKNQKLVCKRRWNTLQNENAQLQNRSNTLKQQLKRQQNGIKDRYEQYLNKINKYNTKLIYLNNCQDESVISEHLIQEMSLVQRQRKSIEDQYNRLKYDYQQMSQVLEQAKRSKAVIMDLFSDSNQQTKLSNAMRIRIGQLTDLVYDLKLQPNNPKIISSTNVIESVKDQHKKLKDRLQFLNMRYQQTIKGKASVQEVQVANFFNKLFVDKDQKMDYRAKLIAQLNQKVQGLINKKSLIEQKCKILRQTIENSLFQVPEKAFDDNNNLQMKAFTFNKDELDYSDLGQFVKISRPI